MRDAFHFSSEKKYNVSFQLGDKIFRGELFLMPEKIPYLSIIDDGAFSHIQSECPDILVCRFGNDSFTLFSCEKRVNNIYPALIISNLPENYNGFSCVEFSINELNVFLNDNFISVSYEDQKFSREINNKEFEVKIECRNDIKIISNYWNSWSETTHENDIVTRFYQRNIMRIEYHDSVGIVEIKNIIYHFLNVMTLLTLIKCNLNYAWVVVDGKRYEIYFPTMIKKHTGELNFLHALIDLSRLDDKKWSLIINNSFKDELFKDFWPRFCGMLSYDSYWEYELLGFISILDFYLAKKFPVKKGKRVVSLIDRYSMLKNETNVDVINFISLTDEDFSLLVKIRNGVAHCDPEKIKLVSNFTKLSILIKKVTVLLSYLSLRDLGVSDAEYASHASRVFNDISRNALLETKWLKKNLPGVRVIQITESNYKELSGYSSGRVNNAIFVENDGEGFKFDVGLTKFYDSSWWKNMKSYEKITEYIDNEICLNEYSGFQSEYVGLLHVYCDGFVEDFIELNGVHFLKKNQSV